MVTTLNGAALFDTNSYNVIEEWSTDSAYAATVIELEDEDYPLPSTRAAWLPFLQKRQSSLMWEMESNFSTQQ